MEGLQSNSRSFRLTLADHGQAQPHGQRLAQVRQRQLDVLPGVLGLVLADHAARDACRGELAGELATLDDAVVPVPGVRGLYATGEDRVWLGQRSYLGEVHHEQPA